MDVEAVPVPAAPAGKLPVFANEVATVDVPAPGAVLADGNGGPEGAAATVLVSLFFFQAHLGPLWQPTKATVAPSTMHP